MRPLEASIDDETTVAFLKGRVAQFVAERDWVQFHNPKDLAMAISVEASELQELLLWRTYEEVRTILADPRQSTQLQEELADVVILCLSLANRAEIDLSSAIVRKLAVNAERYPVDRVLGRADKYTSYQDAETERP